MSRPSSHRQAPPFHPPEIREPPDEEKQMVANMVDRLMDAHERRAKAQETSRQLFREMNDMKTWLREWMGRYHLGELNAEERKRKFVRKKRKVYQKVNVDVILDWIEADYGISERKRYENRISKTKKTVAQEIYDYKITYHGTRKAGERNPGAVQRARSFPSSNF